ncbi:MAG: hypothetical protein WB711_05900 [Terriglobales bacterium]
MKIIPCGSIVGYDVVSGEKLFTETIGQLDSLTKQLPFQGQTIFTLLTGKPTVLWACVKAVLKPPIHFTA